MRIAGIYSFNNGKKAVTDKYPDLLREVKASIAAVDASKCRTKESEEKTMSGTMLFSPVALNNAFKQQMLPKGWKSLRVKCEYPTQFYSPGYQPKSLRKGASRLNSRHRRLVDLFSSDISCSS